MARIRQRCINASFPIKVGENFMDFTYPFGDGPWVWTSDINSIAPRPVDFSFKELTGDELHPGPPYRSGGNFSSLKWSTDQYTEKGFIDIADRFYRMVTSFLPGFAPANYHSWASFESIPDSWGDVESYGATGWNRFRPTRPGAGMGVFLGEFRDVPRTLMDTARTFKDLWKSFAGAKKWDLSPKTAARRWLSTQFGWLPFIGDLRRFYKTTRILNTRLNRLRYFNGRWEKRGGVVSSDSESVVVAESDSTPGCFPVGNTGFFTSPAGSYQVIRTSSNKIWFVGRFRYWIPGDPESFRWKGRAVSMLYGLTPSPSLVWELIPWSWLIDWWSNAGDVIANISSTMFDNLTAKYAYIMGTTKETVVSTGVNNYIDNPVSLSWSSEISRKSRMAASPFGFGLTGLDFTARQWSILTSLGLDRMRY
jgi:hypothetical protein